MSSNHCKFRENLFIRCNFSTGVQNVENLNSFGNACAGFFAAFFSSLTLCPTELIKCRLQAMREIKLQSDASVVSKIADSVLLLLNYAIILIYIRKL